MGLSKWPDVLVSPIKFTMAWAQHIALFVCVANAGFLDDQSGSQSSQCTTCLVFHKCIRIDPMLRSQPFSYLAPSLSLAQGDVAWEADVIILSLKGNSNSICLANCLLLFSFKRES